MTKSRIHYKIATLIAITVINTAFLGCQNRSNNKNADHSPEAGTKDQAGSSATLSAKVFPLFNGHSFDGWNVDTNYFSIRDSVIVGGTLRKPIEEMLWITTKKKYTDFQLDVDVMLTGGDEEERPNSGIWFRCRFNEGGMLVGYEADMMINLDEKETKDSIWWGSLHDPFRRDFDEFNIVGNQDSLRKTLKLEGWNHFKIYCKGPDIKVWLNDILTAAYVETDKSIARSGIIGLQLHDGPPTEVRFKNVMLREL
ncbi:DUF1080 domain-containing protein [Fulvivirgaceae bacterium BMA12]|uniref:DUF1080 domain-containing protein n=1 Tax=Agaribacillus aureus TaxID=3051825 RepID=A0ABT8LG94_9BACT|nr:DUF1080 domain-containing protein [Fulvivirgaceae bacterium BMA12]